VQGINYNEKIEMKSQGSDVMGANSRISSTPIFIVILLLSVSLSAAEIHPPLGTSVANLSAIRFVSNIETIGVAVSGTGLPAQGELYYRQSGATDWRPAHPLLRIDDGRLVGSLFNLSPATSYDVRVVVDSSEITGSALTQPDQLSFTPSVILHVDDNASPGGDGSSTAPYKTIQEAVNHAGPGTQVLVADGIYGEAITFPSSGTDGNWIQVKAEGNGAVLDSAEHLSGNIWTQTSTSKVWFTKIGGPVAYLARSGTRFYQYDDLNGLLQAKGHAGVTINEGWFYEPGTSRLYIRSLDDPAAHLWQLPRLNHAFDASARDWLWIEGFEIRFYGTTTNGCGVCTLNSSHLVIRRNKIHNMQLGIFVNWNGSSDQGNDTRVEGNEVYDPGIYDWPWGALKASYMEGTGIIIRGHIGAIVRDNVVHSYFNGIYTGSSGALENPELAFDADIYQNHMYNISDDGLEPEGACINQRFRNNTVDKSFIGISIAPVTQGPTWVLRNTFTSFTGRAIKFADDSDGIVLIYHNTAWTTVGNVNSADLITAIHHVKMRNNIFQNTGYSIYEVPTGSTANDWNYDDWYTTRGTAGPHFKWENVNYNTISALCKASGLECSGSEAAPGFTNPSGGDFTLLASSPNIDRGIPIPGIDDGFAGNAPDIGAYEFATVASPLTVLSITRMNSNPTGAASVDFELTLSKPVTGVDVIPPFTDFKLSNSTDLTGTTITAVTAMSGSTYRVSVNTGSGNGTLRLDIVDDDSIIDVQGEPLGGAGAGNGNFSTGETYTINRSITNLITTGFRSTGAYDGWVLESGENTNTGGTLDRNATTISVGDDARNRQYRGILSFNTSALPDNAVIVSVQVKVKRQGIVGTNPFATHGSLLVEIRSGAFSNNIALQKSDFSDPATAGSSRDSMIPLTSTWYVTQLRDVNLPLVSRTGSTQFRLYFSKDDNNDKKADTIRFYSGNSTSANVPQLIVTYYVP
jgi:hypothetical protein